jgi:hypothetical protein
LAYARFAGAGAVGVSGFGGVGFGHDPDPRMLNMREGVETLGLGPLPPGFLASEAIQRLAETVARGGGGGSSNGSVRLGAGTEDPGDEREASFRLRAGAHRRAVTSNVQAGLEGTNPPGGTFVDVAWGGGGDEAAPSPRRGNSTPRARPPVTSGSRTMSLNAHAGVGYD